MSKKDHKENKTAEAELNKETQNTEETAELNEQEIEESNEVVEEAASEDATNNNEESEQVALIEKLEKELNDTKDSLLRKAAAHAHAHAIADSLCFLDMSLHRAAANMLWGLYI